MTKTQSTMAALLRPGDVVCGKRVATTLVYQAGTNYCVTVTFDDGTECGWLADELVEKSR